MTKDPNTTIETYLRGMPKEILTVEQEKKLALRIKKGGGDGKRAHKEMVEANLRLVIKIARGYEGRGLPFWDLVQEGNIGLMKAVERYNPRFENKFSTYASWWIKQRIRRALDNEHGPLPFRAPVHISALYKRICRTRVQLRKEHEGEVTDATVAERIGISVEKLSRTVKVFEHSHIRLEDTLPVSGGSDNATYADVIGDPGEPEINGIDIEDEIEALKGVLSELAPRERDVLVRRFGLWGNEKQTLEEIGRYYGVTRERIRQIQSHTLIKLRAPRRLKRLSTFRYSKE